MKKLLDVWLYGDEIVFSDGNRRPAFPEERIWFQNRKLKAVKQKDGQYKILRFCDYHRHSGYSLLDGCISIKDMVAATDYAGAITDHGNMYASLAYYTAMKEAGKVPIIGEEFYCETIDGQKEGNHLILLAKNNKGYKNLLKLSSKSFHNFYRKPHISYEMLKEHSEGLICTSACLAGEIPQIILDKKSRYSSLKEREDKLDEVICWFKKIFKDDYYIEIQNHHISDENIVNPELIRLAKKHNVKLVAATDSHYVHKDDEKVHDVILCISTKKTLADENRLRFEGEGYHIHSADEVDALFSDIPEAIDNTLEILEKCQGVEIETGKNYLPHFPIPNQYANDFEYLKAIATEGFKSRFLKDFSVTVLDNEETAKMKIQKKKEYWERWKYEMKVIEQMGFAGYFLVVWDFLKFCRDNNIPVGPGRGSGAGSLVLYCLYITDFDPIKYGLLFERFLNPDRISLPDVDSDISERKRELVIEYVTKKYGEDHVAHIITFGTLAAKSAVRDVAKVLGLSPSEAANLTKVIPTGPKMTIDMALQMSPALVQMVKNNTLYEEIIDIARKIEGLPRQTGVHACFDKDTLIRTIDGYKRICEIQEGDMVLTHKNRYRKVLNTIVTETNKEICLYPSSTLPIKATPNHPFLVRSGIYIGTNKVGYTKPEWKSAEDIALGDYVCTPVRTFKTVKRRSRSFIEDGMLWHEIRRIENYPVDAKLMYNLTVDEDSSYTANDVVVHNCGIIISPKPVDEYCPLAVVNDSDGTSFVTTQFTGPECEAVGLVKFDFLGLRTLDVIDSALDQIREKDPFFTMKANEIPLNDIQTYLSLSRGNTSGVFQFESDGMTSLVKKMFTDVTTGDTKDKGDEYFERLIAAVSLFRPGPMDEIPNYLDAMKSGNVIYDHPKLKNILSSTYGVLVYQGATRSQMKSLSK